MTFFKTSLAVAAVTLCLGAGASFAQTTTPATPAPAAAAPAATAPMTKAQISKACSAEATKEKLKGKAKKAFLSDCKKKGGPTA